MRTYAALFVILCLALPIFSATKNKKTTRSTTRKATSSSASKEKATQKASSRSATAKTSSSNGATKAAARKSGRRKSGTRATARSRTERQSWRTRQMAPTPERYREIQQALIEKGYLQGEPSGEWGPDCTEAVKKFQRNQNLEPSGKLDSLTLISLGLGPRREPLGSTAGMNTTPPAAEAREP